MLPSDIHVGVRDMPNANQTNTRGNVKDRVPNDDDIFYVKSLNKYFCGLCKVFGCQHCPKNLKDIEKKLPPPVTKQSNVTTSVDKDTFLNINKNSAEEIPSEVTRKCSTPKSKSGVLDVRTEPEMTDNLFLTPERKHYRFGEIHVYDHTEESKHFADVAGKQ